MDLQYRRAGALALALGLACTATAGASSGPAKSLPIPDAGLSPEDLLTGTLQSTPGLPVFAAKTHARLGLHEMKLNVLDGATAVVRGVLRPDLVGRVIGLEVHRGRHWVTIARTLTGAGGHFRLRYVPRRLGSDRARLRFAGDSRDRATDRSIGRLNSYRQAEASWYGGGGTTACGSTLSSWTLGVANKTLPCGTKVTLRYHGHTVRVPVIDRGPYVYGREFDLTEATKRALGFGDIGEVWATS